MTTYLALKHLHLTLVALVGLLFLLRGILLLQGSPRLQTPVLRILPHALSGLLLLSGVALALQLPAVPTWVLLKLLLLLVFIALGVITFKRARTTPARVAGLAASLLLYGLIAHIAVSHGGNPLS